MAVNYHDYLKLDEILSAQKPLSDGEHDEMLFIIIHQTYELWFKQVLHESEKLNTAFKNNEVNTVVSTLNRILTIFKTLVQQIDILETMTPLSFISFRDRLETSSGFQSFQFRRLEFYLGVKSAEKMNHYPENSVQKKELEFAYRNPSLYDIFLNFLSEHYQLGIPEIVLNRNYTENYTGNSDVQKVILEIYKKDTLLNIICERLVDWDEGLQEWRYRHVKMVERTIGLKMGTGGSPGIEYLKQSLFRPAFPDLWSVRSQF